MNKVRVVASPDYPYVSSCFKDLNFHNGINFSKNNCSKPGYEIEFIQTVLQGFLHLNVEWIQADSFNQSIEYLDSGKADMSGATYRYDDLSTKLIASPAITFHDIAIFGKEIDIHDVEPGSLFGAQTSFEKTFHKHVWTAVICVTVLSIFLARFPRKLSKFMTTLWFVCLNIFLSVFSNLMAIDTVIPSKSRSLPFKTMDELGEMLNTGQCKIGMLEIYQEYDFPSIFFPSHNMSWAEGFRKVHKTNPAVKISGKLTEFILQGNKSECHVAVDYKAFRESHEHSHCRIKMLELPYHLEVLPSGFYHNLGWLADQLDVLLTTDSVIGLYQFLSTKYFAHLVGQRECDYEENGVEWSPLSLGKVFSTIAVTLMAGFGLAAIMIVVEKVASLQKKSRKENVEKCLAASAIAEVEAELDDILRRMMSESETETKCRILYQMKDCINRTV